MISTNAGLKYQLYQVMFNDNALKENNCKRVPFSNEIAEITALVSNNTK